MDAPYPILVGLRYSLARKRSLLLSFVSLASMLGVSLGVAVLIVALSVINGSIATLRGEALKSVPHATVSGPALRDAWPMLVERAGAAEGVAALAPFIEGEAILRWQGRDAFVRLRGVDPELEPAVADGGPRFDALMARLGETDGGVVLGARLAAVLGVPDGGTLGATPLAGLLARDISDWAGLRMVGAADFGIYGNGDVALTDLATARSLFARDEGAALALRVRVDDVLQAGAAAARAFADWPALRVRPWNEAQAGLFNALNIEKTVTAFMLLTIVAVGAMNIISTLVMTVSDKSADIAILRTIGAGRLAVTGVFVTMGFVAGLAGTAAGAALGVVLAENIAALSLLLERAVNALFADADVHLVSHLRTRTEPGEVLLVCAAALLISLLATLYPAWRAGRTPPAAALRRE